MDNCRGEKLCSLEEAYDSIAFLGSCPLIDAMCLFTRHSYLAKSLHDLLRSRFGVQLEW